LTKRNGLRNWLFYVAYIFSVGTGFGIMAHLLLDQPLVGIDWVDLGVFFVLLLLGETALSQSQVGGGKFLSSKTLVLAIIILFGPTAAALSEAISTLLRGFLVSRSEPRKTVFNTAMHAGGAGLAGIVYHAMPWHEQFTSPLFLVPLIVALLVHTNYNRLMFALILSLDSRIPFERVIRRSTDTAKLRNFLDAPLAATVVLLYMQAGVWTLALGLFPLLVLYQSDRLFENVKEAHINSIAALTTALEADEPYTHGHSYRVMRYSQMIGKAMGMGDRDLETLEYGGLLHDIGKIAITNDIINKPGRLTEEEFADMRRHPTIGADIVDQIKFLREASDLVRHHHERPDGKGYPHGLRDGQISLGCHILNACDAFDAMTSDRPYRKALTVERAIEELVRHKGTQFDSRVVDTVLELYHKGEFTSIRETDGLLS
jgi:putative nucleotidyltransferase with HDIG domain